MCVVKTILLLTLAFASSIEAQFFYHQPRQALHLPTAAAAAETSYYQFSLPSPTQQYANTPSQYAHPAVINNALREAEYPAEYRKSDRFYKNPHIAAALAKESWFTDKEMPVLHREAEKIPREMVFKIFKNAGWIKRR